MSIDRWILWADDGLQELLHRAGLVFHPLPGPTREGSGPRLGIVSCAGALPSLGLRVQKLWVGAEQTSATHLGKPIPSPWVKGTLPVTLPVSTVRV
jgi:hypothetical protein